MAQGILVDTLVSVISSGTERSKIEMGEKGLLAKARARPDLARKVIKQAQKEGVQATLDLVRDRLSSPQPLGYSACGVVRRVGNAAGAFTPGQMVAIAGAGFANHAEVNYVPAFLAAAVPANVAPEEAAFATLGSIAMHGVRQAELTQGELVVVCGLGLIGQITVRILRAYGHPVVGVDLSQTALAEVGATGIETMRPDDARLLGLKADAVLLTAATPSPDPVQMAPLWCRDRARVVVVGDVGLSLKRPAYYDNEVDLRFSRSYGPGRYDREYEELGNDYPIGYVRWTEARNLSEFLRLLSEGLLSVRDLIDGRYAIEHAPEAYERLARGERARALLLAYGDGNPEPQVVHSTSRLGTTTGRLRVSVCGAGNFARKVLIPNFEATKKVDWAYISTASGLTGAHIAEKRGFRAAVATASEAVDPRTVDAVVIATRHDSHSQIALLCADRQIPAFVEKPLALSIEALEELEASEGAGNLTTGFNRRYAGSVLKALPAIRTRTEPAMLQMRVNAGQLAPNHWADAPDQGGRVIGEACHFIDLACFLTGSAVSRVTAIGAGRRPLQVEDSVEILLHHADGSASTLAYFANGSSNLPKERVEFHWESQSLVIDDFRAARFDSGKRSKSIGGRKQDKGHSRLIAAYVDFVLGNQENPVPFHQAAHVTRVSFAVLEAMATAEWVELEPVTW